MEPPECTNAAAGTVCANQSLRAPAKNWSELGEQFLGYRKDGE